MPMERMVGVDRSTGIILSFAARWWPGMDATIVRLQDQLSNRARSPYSHPIRRYEWYRSGIARAPRGADRRPRIAVTQHP
jgi:hypothetical protein